MNKYFAFSLIIVFFITGIGIGFMISPEYGSMKESVHTTDLGIADDEYDLRFIDAMIVHHLGAIEMANEAKSESRRSEIRELSSTIITAQTKEIEDLYTLKKDWYGDTKTVKLNEFSMNVNLGSYDEKFDLRFINAMIAHHNMAIEMAQDAQKKSTRNEILTIANDIIVAQTKEIKTMEQWREDWYFLTNNNGD